ncbi:unnamed protein product, partial [Linum tenue]
FYRLGHVKYRNFLRAPPEIPSSTNSPNRKLAFCCSHRSDHKPSSTVLIFQQKKLRLMDA